YSMSANSTANMGWNATNTSIADGGYNVSFYCNDSADNWNRTVSRMFSKDATIPLVTIISPLAKNYSATSIEFNVSTNENATCLYSLDGGAVNVTMTRNATDTGFNYTNASIVNGAYNVSFYCNDTNGNFNRSVIRGFGMDNVVPGVGIVNPANVTYSAGNTSIRFNISTTEAATSCWYSLNSGLFNYSMSANSTANMGWNATNTSIADGGYNVSFYCNELLLQ
ncbi:hypothetical protein HYT26_02905, partial [Candidatus Pacearchaeota archaeon]|nr:hypothetical protein [Candidatus Pacearchaeota archaeon]